MEISRDGHRARMRAAYLQGGGDAMPDHQLLELLLSISIPRKDVKPIAYALINRFGSLEQVYLVTLDGSAKILQTHAVGSGSVNLASVDQRTLMEHILRDNASAVMLAHNHPGGKAQPSAQDLEFTIRLLSILRSIHVQLLDHIIVSPTDTYSMRSDPEYGSFFTVK